MPKLTRFDPAACTRAAVVMATAAVQAAGVSSSHGQGELL